MKIKITPTPDTEDANFQIVWRLSGIHEKGGRYAFTEVRHGDASTGEPSTMTQTRWFETRALRDADLTTRYDIPLEPTP